MREGLQQSVAVSAICWVHKQRDELLNLGLKV